jgi:hypothetical protein
LLEKKIEKFGAKIFERIFVVGFRGNEFMPVWESLFVEFGVDFSSRFMERFRSWESAGD